MRSQHIACLLVLGYFQIGSGKQFGKEANKRVKRFLFNKVDEPHITYGDNTFCCECDDFKVLNSCYDNCRKANKQNGFNACINGTCFTTATLMYGRFYLVSRCVPGNATSCARESNVFSTTQGCKTLRKEDMADSSTCGYCCRGPDLRVHNQRYENYCTDNIDQMIQHAYGQNNISTNNPTTRWPNMCPEDDCQYVHTEKPSTSGIGVFDLNKLCLKDAMAAGKYEFAYPGNETRFIICNEAGSATPMICPPGTIWNDGKITCVNRFAFPNLPTTTKSTPAIFKTTSPPLPSTLNMMSQKTSAYTSSQTSRMSSSTPKKAGVSLLYPTINRNTSTSSGASGTTHLSNITTNKGRFTVAPTRPKRGISCHICTDDTECNVADCMSTDSYCLNVIRIGPNSKQTIVKKSCASLYECQYDHSSSSQCEAIGRTNSSTFTNGSVVCQFCCHATNALSPCNKANIPANIEWFQGSASTTQTDPSSMHIGITSGPVSDPSTSRLTTVPGTSTSKTLNTPSSLNVSSPRESSLTTVRRTSLIQVLNKTTPAPAKTTQRHPFTLPPTATKCRVCTEPKFLCERITLEKECESPNHYCINTVRNYRNGSRSVDRRCDNFETCYRDWFLGSSDSDKCRKFDEHQTITLEFTCTYCCVKDGCNLHLRPADDTLYKDG